MRSLGQENKRRDVPGNIRRDAACPLTGANTRSAVSHRSPWPAGNHVQIIAVTAVTLGIVPFSEGPASGLRRANLYRAAENSGFVSRHQPLKNWTFVPAHRPLKDPVLNPVSYQGIACDATISSEAAAPSGGFAATPHLPWRPAQNTLFLKKIRIYYVNS